MSDVSEFLQEQKRIADDAQADNTSIKVDATTGRWQVSSSKRTIVAMDRLVDSVPVMIVALKTVLAVRDLASRPGDAPNVLQTIAGYNKALAVVRATIEAAISTEEYDGGELHQVR